jgi:hypothetical protein
VLVVAHAVEGVVEAPRKYPDIYVVGNLTVCWGCFCVYFGWLVWRLWMGEFGWSINWLQGRKSKG